MGLSPCVASLINANRRKKHSFGKGKDIYINSTSFLAPYFCVQELGQQGYQPSKGKENVYNTKRCMEKISKDLSDTGVDGQILSVNGALVGKAGLSCSNAHTSRLPEAAPFYMACHLCTGNLVRQSEGPGFSRHYRTCKILPTATCRKACASTLRPS